MLWEARDGWELGGPASGVGGPEGRPGWGGSLGSTYHRGTDSFSACLLGKK